MIKPRSTMFGVAVALASLIAINLHADLIRDLVAAKWQNGSAYSAVAFGKDFVVAAKSNQVNWWDFNSPNELGHIERSNTDTGAIIPSSLATSESDFSFIESTGAENLLRRFQPTGHEVESRPVFAGMRIRFCAASADGQLLAAVGNQLDVINCSNVNTLVHRDGRDGRVISCDFSKTGDRLVIAQPGDQDGVSLIDVRDDKVLATSAGLLSKARAVAISPDGKLVAAICTARGSIGVSILEVKNERLELRHHITEKELGYLDSSSIYDGERPLAFFPDGNSLAVSTHEAIVVIDLKSRTKASELLVREGAEFVSIAPDGQHIASVGVARSVALWRLADSCESLTPALTRKSHDPGKHDSRLCFAPDSKTLAIACSRVQPAGPADVAGPLSAPAQSKLDQFKTHAPRARLPLVVILIDPVTGKLTGQLSTSEIGAMQLSLEQKGALEASDYLTAIRFSPNGKRLIASTERHALLIWSIESKTLETVLTHPGPIDSFDISPDNSMIAYASAGKLFLAYSDDDWRVARVPTHFAPHVIFAPNGSRLICGLSHYTLKGGEPLFEAEDPRRTEFKSMVISKDGHFAYGRGRQSMVVRWDIDTGKLSYPFSFHSRDTAVRCTDIALSPDAPVLATAASDGIVRLWNVETGAELKSLHAHQGNVDAVAFAHNGKSLASIGVDGTTRLWNVECVVKLPK